MKYADEIIVLSKGVQKYFMDTYGRETHFIPNGVNRPEVREAKLIRDHFGLEKDSYILFLGRLVPEKGIRYLVEAFKSVETDKKLVIAGGSSDTDSFMEELKELAKGDDRILFTGFVQGAMLDKEKSWQQRWIKYYKRFLPNLEEEYDVAIGFLEGDASYYVIDKVKAKKKILWMPCCQWSFPKAARHF